MQLLGVGNTDTSAHSSLSTLLVQLLGANLAEVRRAMPLGRAGPLVLRSVATGLLDAIQAVHAAGYIHRHVMLDRPCDLCIP